MKYDLIFFITNISLGFGLAMDAFSVSLANGLNEPCMKKRRMTYIASVFTFFQAFMPLVGWVCIHTVVEHFKAFEEFIPWIALILLGFIGGKMLYEGITCKDEVECKGVGFWGLILQGIATSIDALSVGFTIADYDFFSAFLSSTVIATVTFAVCFAGIIIGKKVGTRLAGKANIFGGIVLIVIGLEIFITNIV
ncbi:MAG: manganese efflux pump [Clostridia bacterium]|nr:manganese efflux pump [Clostridia bacterium]